MPVLSKRALEGLRSYQYKPAGYTVLDDWHQPFWNCARLVSNTCPQPVCEGLSVHEAVQLDVFGTLLQIPASDISGTGLHAQSYLTVCSEQQSLWHACSQCLAAELPAKPCCSQCTSSQVVTMCTVPTRVYRALPALACAQPDHADRRLWPCGVVYAVMGLPTQHGRCEAELTWAISLHLGFATAWACV